MPLPLDRYDYLVSEGLLVADPAQRDAALALDQLAEAVNDYDPAPRGLFRRRPEPPRGLYLWGGVGAGKSLLMDMFFTGARVQRKRRVHFHAFMQETHRFIADWRRMDDHARRHHPSRETSAKLDDPIPHAARAVFDDAWLLCFDELQVTDITDATLIGRLFENLFELGCVIVATSNRHPDDLYKDGLNRSLFLPSIELIKKNLRIRQLAAAKDYRLDQLEGDQVYFSPLDDEARRQTNYLFSRMTTGVDPEPEEFDLGKRTIVVPLSGRGVARARFDHWCSDRFGPGDYLTIASHFPVVFIDDIPQLGPSNRNEAKRFVTFIDALYEAKSMLICSAAAEPDALYPSGDGSFEFQRTASRLHEMQSRQYLETEHVHCRREAQ